MLKYALFTGSACFVLHKITRSQWFFEKAVRSGLSYLCINKFDLTKETDKSLVSVHMEQQNKYLYTRTTDTNDDKTTRIHWWNTNDNIYVVDLWDKNVVYLCNYKVKYQYHKLTNLLPIMCASVNTLVLKTTTPEINGLVGFNQDNEMIYMPITNPNPNPNTEIVSEES